MKKLILASATLLALAACSSDDDSNGFSCSVSRTNNSVSIHETYRGQTYTQTQTVYVDDYGESYSIFTTDISFTSSEEAAYECAEEKDEARRWKDGSYQVECTSNSVHVVQRDDSHYKDLDNMAANFQSMCDEGYQRAKNGTLDDDDEDWD